MTTIAPRTKTIIHKACVGNVEYSVLHSVSTHFVTLGRDHSVNLAWLQRG
ncbi:hypothetical protein [Deinococcus hopiensis]|nr:hypothetical protein [Deinococcus hopiensis]